ncbi:MAG: hypothetical protein ACPGVO_10070 [Spirulinaceae cyanobacterium]
MSQFTQRTILSAGLATLALALAPAAQAQIQVTGGVIDGEAAFFQAGGGNTPISLFDINISNMQIVSPNGVLTNPDFVPTAAGGFVDSGPANTPDNQVSANDTGLIVGKLSGIGFDEGGSIVPFSNVTTALAYRVTNFNGGTPLPGFLVDGDSIPQLFFTDDPTPLAAGFTKTAGNMTIGDFNSNITAGVIDLPSTLQISSSGSFGSVFDLTASDDDLGTGSSASRALTDNDDKVDDTFADTNDDDTAVNIAFNFNSTNVTFTNTQTFTVNGSTDFTTSSSTSLSEIKALIEEILEDLDIESLSTTATLALFTGGGDSDTVRYEIVNSPTYNVRVRQNRRGDIKIRIKVKNRRGRRYFVALRGDALVGGFKQCGPGSRAFPGLVGLEALSEEEAEELLAEIQADEAETEADDDSDDVADDDSDDDAEDSDDDDAEDDDDDSEDDDDDAEDDGDVAEDAPSDVDAVEGLDSLSDEEVDAINEQIDSFGTDPAEDVTPVEGLDSTDATTPEEAIGQ